MLEIPEQSEGSEYLSIFLMLL